MTPRYKGMPIALDGRDFIVPPLCFFDIERLLPLMEKIESMTPIEAFGAMTAIIHAAFARNYPELTVDELKKMLDPTNIGEIVERVMEASGLKKKATPDEASPSTGTDSTPS